MPAAKAGAVRVSTGVVSPKLIHMVPLAENTGLGQGPGQRKTRLGRGVPDRGRNGQDGEPEDQEVRRAQPGSANSGSGEPVPLSAGEAVGVEGDVIVVDIEGYGRSAAEQEAEGDVGERADQAGGLA